MSGVNKVIIIGNICKEVEVKFMPNGSAVANLTVATNEKWRDKQTDEQKEKTEFHRVVIFGKLAEIAGKYLKKGSNVYLEGSLQTRKWTNQQGQDQYTTEIVLQGFSGVMQMLDSKPQHQGDHSQQGQQSQQGQSPHQQSYNKAHPQQNDFQQEQQKFQKSQQNNQQGGFSQQQTKVNPQEPSIDFDDDLPF